MAVKVGVHEKGALKQYDALLVVVEESTTVVHLTEYFGEHLGKFIANTAVKRHFKYEDGSALTVTTNDANMPGVIILAGVSKKTSNRNEGIRRAVGVAVTAARSMAIVHAALSVVGLEDSPIDHEVLGALVTEAALLAQYRFTKYKTKNNTKNQLKNVTLFLQGRKHELAVESGIRAGKLNAEAAIFARDLVNEPAGAMHPKTLAAAALSLALQSDRITVSVFDRVQIAEFGMGAYLGVAQGSMYEPQLIHLVHRNSQKPKKVIALIGKAITFDSGGLSIKPAHAMETMKCDMAGAAAVLGVFHALLKLDLPLEIHGITPACENMVSDTAIRPGDILKTMSGKTVEVLNTDAEGRLTLADAITYAKEKVKPDLIIDLATLTGACVVALGDDIAGVMGNDQGLVRAVLDAGHEAGELMWELPLPQEYKPMLKSVIADYTNITPSRRGAGASTAGLFLQEFVGTTPWVHMDIAGPAFIESNSISYMPRGGSGYGVRTILKLLHTLAQ